MASPAPSRASGLTRGKDPPVWTPVNSQRLHRVDEYGGAVTFRWDWKGEGRRDDAQRPFSDLTDGESDDHPHVGGLGALLALGHLELHLLVLVEVAVALSCDRAEMHEDVGATFILGDE